jgi:hypothetical protein|tara:strand:- start:628 stop:1158 length:531 start_codon:yes stop_codon:yes gene_type:complete
MLLSIALWPRGEIFGAIFLRHLTFIGGNKMSMKLNKSIAALTQPTPSTEGMLAQANANASSVIIVGFANVDIYGKQSGTWSLINELRPENFLNDDEAHDTYAVDLSQYEDVHFTSVSGKQETMRYFFVEDHVVAPTVQGSKANKLEDISDMPTFTVADAGKVLTVDAQGSLIWVTR